MIQFVLWLGLSLLLAYSWRKTPWKLVLAVVAVKVLVPSVAGSFLSGSWDANDSIHPSTWLLIVSFAVVVAAHAGEFASKVRSNSMLMFLMAFTTLFFAIETYFLRSGAPVGRLVNVYLFPFLLFVLVRAAAEIDRGAWRKMVLGFLTLAGIEAAIALVQVATGSSIFWTDYLTRFWWYRAGAVSRATGTLDSPLDLGYLLAVATPLLIHVRSAFLRYGTVFLFLAGVLATQSRQSLVAILFAVVFVVLRSKAHFFVKMLVSVSMAASTIWLVSGSVGSGVLARFMTDDGRSSSVRNIAYEYTWQNLGNNWLLGGGFGSSYELQGLVLSSSLENSYAILLFDAGGLVALIYTSIAISVLVGKGLQPGLRISGVLAVVLAAGYSGFMTQSACGALMWLVLALATPRGIKPPEPDPSHLSAPETRGRSAKNQRPGAVEPVRQSVGSL